MSRLIWGLGTIGVTAGILENAWTAHSQLKFSEKDQIALNNAVRIQLVNGMGLCLLSSRKSKLRSIPAMFLATGSVLFPGMIFYSKIYDDRRFIKLVMVGGSSSVLGWFFMTFV